MVERGSQAARISRRRRGDRWRGRACTKTTDSPLKTKRAPARSDDAIAFDEWVKHNPPPDLQELAEYGEPDLPLSTRISRTSCNPPPASRLPYRFWAVCWRPETLASVGPHWDLHQGDP